MSLIGQEDCKMFKLVFDGKIKMFEDFNELYVFFDWNVKDIDNAKVYENGKCLGTPTQAYNIISKR